MLKTILIIGGTYILFSFIHYAAKKKKPFFRAFLSMLLGAAVLALVDLTSGLTGVYLPVTQLSLVTAAVGGVPGTALMVLLTVL